MVSSVGKKKMSGWCRMVVVGRYNGGGKGFIVTTGVIINYTKFKS